MNNIRKLSYTIIIFLIVFFVFVIWGCNPPYRSYKFSKGEVSFSFEYPSFMIKPLIWSEEILGEEGFVVLCAIGSPDVNSNGTESLFIKIYKPSVVLPDAETLYRNDLHEILKGVPKGIKNIIEKESIFIDDFPANKLVYTYSISDNISSSNGS
jgi:hypothetical protein